MGLFWKSVPQSHVFIIERFGIYHKTLTTGLHFLWPFVDKIAAKWSMKEKLQTFEKAQQVITKDNVTMSVNACVYYQITDPKLFTYGSQNPTRALENLTITTLRNTIGELELDETLSSRSTINAKMRAVLDEATDPWGIKVNRVEILEIEPPDGIRDAMEKQMKAEREKRADILKAEGEKQSMILTAEGEKRAKILAAEADKEAAILKAAAEKETTVRAGEAEAEAIRLINTANPNESYLLLKKLSALEKMADGQATKLIIPSELQSIVSLVNTATEAK